MEDNTAALALEAATQAVTAAGTAVTDAVTASKDATENFKKAKAYSKAMSAALAAAATDEDKVTAAQTAQSATESETAWGEHVTATKEAVADAKATLKALKGELAVLRKGSKASAAKAPKEARVEQNGQKMPGADTRSATLWGIFDAWKARTGSDPAMQDVMQEARDAGVVDGSIKAGYAHWRRFHGITGRVISATKQAERDAAKVAAKAAAKQAKADEAAAKVAAAAAAKAAAAEPAPAA